MENTKRNAEKNLKHIQVYRKLYNLIRQGAFAPGTRLPSEPALAEQLAVSRMTLRRALALLQEDHLVKNIRGKGNYVCLPAAASNPITVSQLFHPIYHCCAQAVRETELVFRIEPPSESFTQALGRNSAAMVIADRWYHGSEKVCAYSLSFLPIEVISEYRLDLNDAGGLKEFLEKDLYGKAGACSTSFSFTTTGNFTSAKYPLSPGSSFILIQETVFDVHRQGLVFSKHYIPAEHFDLRQACFPSRDAEKRVIAP